MKKTMRQSICALLSVMLVLALLAPGAAAAGDGMFYMFPEAGIAFLKVPERMTIEVLDYEKEFGIEMPESAVEFWISDEADEDLVVIGVSEPVDVYRDPSTMAEIMQLRYSGFWYQEISVEPLKKLDEYKDVASFSQMLDE